MKNTHYNTSSSTATEVQLAIDISNIVPYRSNWPVERYYVAEVVEQLKSEYWRQNTRPVYVTRVRDLPVCR